MKRWPIACLIIVGVAAMLRAEPIPAGKGRVEIDVGEKLEVFTYKPAHYSGGPLLLVFHGVGRNADEYRDFAAMLGDRFRFFGRRAEVRQEALLPRALSARGSRKGRPRAAA